MAGEITRKELHPDLLDELLAGGGSGSAGVQLIQEVKSVTASTEGQKEFTIPMDGFNKRIHNFELRIGSITIHKDRYTVQDNKLVFNQNEAGVTQGRRLDFVFTYIKESEQNVMENLIDTKPADVEVQGRTLVNLLGRAGNAIYKNMKYNHSGNTTVEYSDDKMLVKSTNESYIFAQHNIADVSKDNKCFVIAFDSSAQPTQVGLFGIVESVGKHYSNNIYIVAVKYGEITGGSHMDVVYAGTPEVRVGYFRMYEISQDTFNLIKANDVEYTGDKLAEKYPYVDDVKCVVNPYFESKENLLDDTRWFNGYTSADGAIETPTGTNAHILSSLITNLVAGEKYTFSIDGFDESHNLVAYWYENSTNGFHGGGNGKPISFVAEQGKTYRMVVWTKDNSVMPKSVLDDLMTKKLNPVLVKSSTPKSYDECHNSRMMFETKLYDGEKIARDNSGRYIKNSEFTEVILGEEVSTGKSKYGANREFTCLIFNNITYNTNSATDTTIKREDFIMQRYDGKVQYGHKDAFDGDWGSGEAWHFGGGAPSTTNKLYMAIPNSLTGWGADYLPTEEEVRAFFLGWKMFEGNNAGSNYNGIGTKRWAKLWCGIGDKHSTAPTIAGVYISELPTTLNDQGYTPYRLIYKKETPTIEEVKTHGSLVIKDGVDVNIGSGLVLSDLSDVHDGGKHLTGKNLAPSYPIKNILNIGIGTEKPNYMIVNRVFNGMGLGAIHYYFRGSAYPLFNPLREDGEIANIDYVMEDRVNVTSFPHSILTPTNTKEVLEKTIGELSHTNEKLSAENRELHNKIESLPQLSNPNLLINGDFRINQRGQSVYEFNSGSTATYSVDRWITHRKTSDHNRITPLENGLRIEAISSGMSVRIRQKIEEVTSKSLRGKKVTFSIKAISDCNAINFVVIKDVNIDLYSKTFSNVKRGDVVSYTFSVPNDINMLQVQFSTPHPNVLDVEYAKLELGDHATPHVPRTYASELSDCQRYYQKSMFKAMPSSTTLIQLAHNFNTPMRIPPSIELQYSLTDGTVNHIDGFGTGAISITDYRTNGTTERGIYYLSAITSTPPLSTTQQVGGCIVADAEIY